MARLRPALRVADGKAVPDESNQPARHGWISGARRRSLRQWKRPHRRLQPL